MTKRSLRISQVLALGLILGACVQAKTVPGPAEVIIPLTQRQDASAGCTVSTPAKPSVKVRQPFAFTNRTTTAIRVMQNDGDFRIVSIPAGGTSSAMVIRNAENYAYYTVSLDPGATNGGPCQINFLNVVDR